jgi:hypothetical protein
MKRPELTSVLALPGIRVCLIVLTELLAEVFLTVALVGAAGARWMAEDGLTAVPQA